MFARGMESQNPAISNTHLLMDDDMNEPSSLSAESTSMGMRDSVVDALPPNNTDGDVQKSKGVLLYFNFDSVDSEESYNPCLSIDGFRLYKAIHSLMDISKEMKTNMYVLFDAICSKRFRTTFKLQELGGDDLLYTIMKHFVPEMLDCEYSPFRSVDVFLKEAKNVTPLINMTVEYDGGDSQEYIGLDKTRRCFLYMKNETTLNRVIIEIIGEEEIRGFKASVPEDFISDEELEEFESVEDAEKESTLKFRSIEIAFNSKITSKITKIEILRISSNNTWRSFKDNAIEKLKKLNENIDNLDIELNIGNGEIDLDEKLCMQCKDSPLPVKIIVTELTFKNDSTAPSDQSKEQAPITAPFMKQQRAVASQLLYRIVKVLKFESVDDLAAKFVGIKFLVFTPEFTSLQKQTSERVVEAGLQDFGEVLMYNLGNTERRFQDFKKQALEREDVLFIIILDECHHAITLGAHNIYANDETLLKNKNLVVIQVSATPYNILSRFSRVPLRFIKTDKDKKCVIDGTEIGDDMIVDIIPPRPTHSARKTPLEPVDKWQVRIRNGLDDGGEIKSASKQMVKDIIEKLDELNVYKWKNENHPTHYRGLDYFLKSVNHEEKCLQLIREDSFFADVMKYSPLHNSQEFSLEEKKTLAFAAEYIFSLVLCHFVDENTDADALNELVTIYDKVCKDVVAKCVTIDQKRKPSLIKLLEMIPKLYTENHSKREAPEFANELCKGLRQKLVEKTETYQIVRTIIESSRCNNIGKYVVIRVFSNKSGTVLGELLRLTRDCLWDKTKFAVICDFGDEKISEMEDRYFLHRERKDENGNLLCSLSNLRDPMGEPRDATYGDLYSIPGMLILCEKGRQGDTFSHNMFALDLRIRTSDNLMTVTQELGRLCRYPKVGKKDSVDNFRLKQTFPVRIFINDEFKCDVDCESEFRKECDNIFSYYVAEYVDPLPYALVQKSLCGELKKYSKISMEAIKLKSVDRYIGLLANYNGKSDNPLLDPPNDLKYKYRCLYSPYRNGKTKAVISYDSENIDKVCRLDDLWHDRRIVLWAECQIGKTGAYLCLLDHLRQLTSGRSDDVVIQIDGIMEDDPPVYSDDASLRLHPLSWEIPHWYLSYSDWSYFSQYGYIGKNKYALKIALQRTRLLLRLMQESNDNWKTKLIFVIKTTEKPVCDSANKSLRELADLLPRMNEICTDIKMENQGVTFSIINKDSFKTIIQWDGRIDLEKCMFQQTSESDYFKKIEDVSQTYWISDKAEVQTMIWKGGDKQSLRTTCATNGTRRILDFNQGFLRPIGPSTIQFYYRLPQNKNPVLFSVPAQLGLIFELENNYIKKALAPKDIFKNETDRIDTWIFTPTYGRHSTVGSTSRALVDWDGCMTQDESDKITKHIHVLVVRPDREGDLQFSKYVEEFGHSHVIFRIPEEINLRSLGPTYPDEVYSVFEGGVGYSRLCIQIFSYLLGLESVFMVDDSILQCRELDYEKLCENAGKHDKDPPKVCSFAKVFINIEKILLSDCKSPLTRDTTDFKKYDEIIAKQIKEKKNFESYKSIPEEVKTFSDFRGPLEDIAVIGLDRNFARYSIIRRPFTLTHSVYSFFLLNVKSTVTKGAFFPVKNFWEDIEFNQLCHDKGLLTLKSQRFFQVKKNMHSRPTLRTVICINGEDSISVTLVSDESKMLNTNNVDVWCCKTDKDFRNRVKNTNDKIEWVDFDPDVTTPSKFDSSMCSKIHLIAVFKVSDDCRLMQSNCFCPKKHDIILLRYLQYKGFEKCLLFSGRDWIGLDNEEGYHYHNFDTKDGFYSTSEKVKSIPKFKHLWECKSRKFACALQRLSTQQGLEEVKIFFERLFKVFETVLRRYSSQDPWLLNVCVPIECLTVSQVTIYQFLGVIPNTSLFSTQQHTLISNGFLIVEIATVVLTDISKNVTIGAESEIVMKETTPDASPSGSLKRKRSEDDGSITDDDRLQPSVSSGEGASNSHFRNVNQTQNNPESKTKENIKPESLDELCSRFLRSVAKKEPVKNAKCRMKMVISVLEELHIVERITNEKNIWYLRHVAWRKARLMQIRDSQQLQGETIIGTTTIKFVCYILTQQNREVDFSKYLVKIGADKCKPGTSKKDEPRKIIKDAIEILLCLKLVVDISPSKKGGLYRWCCSAPNVLDCYEETDGNDALMAEIEEVLNKSAF